MEFVGIVYVPYMPVDTNIDWFSFVSSCAGFSNFIVLVYALSIVLVVVAEEVDEVLKELERYAPGKSRRIQSQMSTATRSSQESLERSHTASPSSPGSRSAHEVRVCAQASNVFTSHSTLAMLPCYTLRNLILKFTLVTCVF